MSARSRQFSRHSSRHILAAGRVTTPKVRRTKTSTIHEQCRHLQRPRYAYVTLVMRGDEYAIGAAVLGWSLRKFAVQYELVVMVTPDVSLKARKLLMKIFDRVEVINYVKSLTTKSILRGHEYRQEKEWMKYCLTKGNMMRYIEYDKIAWMDADMLALANLDAIFELSTPAGICSSIRDDEKWHGRKLPEAEIKESLLNNYGVRGCIMVLKPCTRDYLMVKSQQHTGHGSVYPGPDEYFYTMLYKDEWHHLHEKYGCSAASESNGMRPAAVHFDLAKPWQCREVVRGESVEKWWLFAKDLITEQPEFANLLPRPRRANRRCRSWLFLSPVERVSFKLQNDYRTARDEMTDRKTVKKLSGRKHGLEKL